MKLVSLRQHRSDTSPTWVYKLRCQHGGLLYVGIAADVDARLRQHRYDKPWWPDVADVVTWLMPTRKAARAAELWAITHEVPMHNIDGVYPNAQYQVNPWWDVVDGCRMRRIAMREGQA